MPGKFLTLWLFITVNGDDEITYVKCWGVHYPYLEPYGRWPLNLIFSTIKPKVTMDLTTKISLQRIINKEKFIVIIPISIPCRYWLRYFYPLHFCVWINYSQLILNVLNVGVVLMNPSLESHNNNKSLATATVYQNSPI